MNSPLLVGVLQVGVDELERFLDDSAECLDRCFEADLSPLD